MLITKQYLHEKENIIYIACMNVKIKEGYYDTWETKYSR